MGKYRSIFEKSIGKEFFEPFFKASVKHHAPDKDDVFQLIVQKADHYASGADRTGESGWKDATAEQNWDSFKDVQMVSIFEGLLKNGAHAYEWKVPIKPLSLDDEHFPVLKAAKAKGQVSYSELWSEFENAFLALSEAENDTMSLSENLSFLLYRFASTVPASTIHLPDVSLYDHLKSTAILALCLYDYLEANKRLDPSFKIGDNEAPILLVGGDLSGIQNYIYDIVSSKAASNLKGRSFYLQILVENAVELILRRLDLPWSSVVYASGGGFYLIAPNTNSVKEALTAAVNELTNAIFEEHQTSLSLNIAWQEVTQGQMLHKNPDNDLHHAWKELAGKIAGKKSQKFSEFIQKDYAFFFKPSEIGGQQERDYITGEEFTEEEAKAKSAGGRNHLVVELEAGKFVKSRTNLQIELGKKLRRTDYWISSKVAVPQWKKQEVKISNLPIYNYLLSKEELLSLGHPNPDEVLIRSFDISRSGYNKQSAFLKGKKCIHGFTFYGGNDFPENPDGSPVTYDEMAERSASGAKKLGVLRMDVDNLGAIFISGLSDKKRTFSRYSVLSRSLDYFFKGYLNCIWKNHFSTNTSIIYSGGDDLFIVGQWEATFDFAHKIRDEFRKWVCDNPALTISGGIAVTGGSFPISKGAEFAEQAEKTAKEYEREMDGKLMDKDAITIFNTPLGWDKEYALVKELKDEMSALIDAELLPRGVLQKILNYAEQARSQAKKGGSTPWRWHMAYDFSRAEKRHKSPESEAFYKKIKNNAFTEGYVKDFSAHTYLDLLEVAARWAEMETK